MCRTLPLPKCCCFPLSVNVPINHYHHSICFALSHRTWSLCKPNWRMWQAHLRTTIRQTGYVLWHQHWTPLPQLHVGLARTIYTRCTQEAVFLFGMARILFGVDTPEGLPPPQTSLPVPPPKQKGYQSATFSNRHPSAYSSRPETKVLQSYGAKTEIRTPMNTWPTRHPLLACTVPKYFQFFRIPLNIPCWHNPVSLK